MKKRKILKAVFSALIILSIAFSMTPFLVENAFASCIPSGTVCSWNPSYFKIPNSECCCTPSGLGEC